MLVGRLFLVNSLVLVLVLLAVFVRQSFSITTLSPCACEYNGHLYNLTSLAKKDGPRFKSSINGYEYGYNPCIPFTKNLDCHDVAICYWSDDEQMFDAIGFQDDVQCIVNKAGIVELVFKQRGTRMGMVSTIQLKCNENLVPIEKAQMEIIKNAGEPVLQVEHKCCCPDGCLSEPAPTVPPPKSKTPILSSTTPWGYLAFTSLLIPIAIAVYFRKKIISAFTRGGQEVDYVRDVGENRNRPLDYGAVRNQPRNQAMIPPIRYGYGEDDDDDGDGDGDDDGRVDGREGVEHEEERIPNEDVKASEEFYFGVPEEKFTNPTQVSEENPERHCNEDLFPISPQRNEDENFPKV